MNYFWGVRFIMFSFSKRFFNSRFYYVKISLSAQSAGFIFRIPYGEIGISAPQIDCADFL